MADFMLGQAVRLRAEFRDAANALVNPTTRTIKVRDPAGAVTTYTGGQLTNPSVGVFHVDVAAALSGTWRWRGESTVPTTASETSFTVAPSAVN